MKAIRYVAITIAFFVSTIAYADGPKPAAAAPAAAAKPKCLDLHALMAPLEKVRTEGQNGKEGAPNVDILDRTVDVMITTTTPNYSQPSPHFIRMAVTEAIPFVAQDYWHDKFRNDLLTIAFTQDEKQLHFPMNDPVNHVTVVGNYDIVSCKPDSITAMLPDPEIPGRPILTTIKKTSDHSFEVERQYDVAFRTMCPGVGGDITETGVVTVTEERTWGPKVVDKDVETADPRMENLHGLQLRALNLLHPKIACIETSDVNGAQRSNAPIAGPGSFAPQQGVGAPVTVRSGSFQ
jgi:hypothetical protein